MVTIWMCICPDTQSQTDILLLLFQLYLFNSETNSKCRLCVGILSKLSIQSGHTRLSPVVTQTFKDQLESPWQFAVCYCACSSSCSVLTFSFKRVFMSKRMWVFGFVWVVQCHTIPLLTSPPQMHRRKETIRPQSSADTKILETPTPSRIYIFFFSFVVLDVLCTVILLSCTPKSQIARWPLLCPALTVPAAHAMQVLVSACLPVFAFFLSTEVRSAPEIRISLY